MELHLKLTILNTRFSRLFLFRSVSKQFNELKPLIDPSSFNASKNIEEEQKNKRESYVLVELNFKWRSIMCPKVCFGLKKINLSDVFIFKAMIIYEDEKRKPLMKV
uniref:Uncharacterized protein n=1 Tax=Cacopsylla melanoneura TaxID=428564 RepID=A0A8D8T6E9_9HEMI